MFANCFASVKRISTRAMTVTAIVTVAMIRAARKAVSGLPNNMFVARGWLTGGGAAALPSGAVMARPP